MLRSKLIQIDINDPQQRTHAELIADNLIRIASSQDRAAIVAAGEILDRTEGRAHQAISVANVPRDVQERSDEDLKHYLDHGCWPDREPETPTATGSGTA
jgi:hypothetical protein